MLKSRGFVVPFLFLVIAAAALSVAACGPTGEAAPSGPSAAPAAFSAEPSPPPVSAQAVPAQAAPAQGASLTAPASAPAEAAGLAQKSLGSMGSAAPAPLPFASAEERARFEAALSAGTALAGPEAAESAEAWARAVEAAGALDETIALLEAEAAKKAAAPQVAFALAALYGRKGLERQEYAALARAEECAKDRPELAFNLAAVYGRKETLKALGKVEELVTGSIRALSEPAGARVFLDGKERGTTPLLVEGLKAGDYELRFELEGHDAQVARLALGAGEPASLSAALKANQGELVIRYTLASAADAGAVRAWLDGKDLGLSKYATHTVLHLPFGSHAIRVEAPGYAPAERTVVTSLREEAVVIKLAKN